MINIEDVREKLQKHPIPDEVKEIRKTIEEHAANLQFVTDDHKYYIINESGQEEEAHSVSRICHKFQREVNWDAIAKRKAAREGRDVDELKREWHEKNIKSTSNGSLTHAYAEAMMYFIMGEPESMPDVIKKMQYEDGYLISYGPKQEAVEWFFERAFTVNELYPVAPEVKICIKSNSDPYRLKYNIAGTLDALFAYKDENSGDYKLIIADWKTNKQLDNEYNQKVHNTLLGQFSNMIDEPLSLYSLQLGLYQMGLQQLGYDITTKMLVWLREDGVYNKFGVPDVTDKLIEALR